ncbi:metallophosphoesterase [Thermomicrobium sp. 4228-Ro]|uniref:metallophosphoesterase family protein n=1 Tax=Thermomicrobium sp. 4228-Ro TaxID=2993937 RepID=UPI0022498514|nr:metallophosphoesterase [Thermomicrobium sp. 4228-Ro]MCX2727407.1 metallophosphoesterase [Thermomicrobium sp. 4228-Ro]
MVWFRKGKDRASRQLALYYTSDVHGSERCFLKFLNAAKFYGVDTLILGGDLTGKVLVPIVQTDGRWEMTFLGRHEVLRSAEEVEEAEKRIRFNGFYPYRCDPDELARMEADPAYAERIFRRVMRESVERWVRLAEERLRGTGVRCFVMPGNDDEFEIDEVLNRSDVVINPDGAVIELDGYQLLSLAWANPTPWNSPRELPEEELAARIERLARELDPSLPVIFNLHCPPYDSTLDSAPQLREDLSVVMVGGQPNMVPVGSRAVREAIERYQPVLSLHGHIHESRGAVRIGRTLCVNPGSAYGEGVLHGALVRLEDDRVASYQLVSG